MEEKQYLFRLYYHPDIRTRCIIELKAKSEDDARTRLPEIRNPPSEWRLEEGERWD